MSDAQRCTATTKDGSPCGAYAVKGDDRCYNHTDTIPEEKRRADHQRAGRAAHLSKEERRLRERKRLDIPDEIHTLQDANRTLSALAVGVARGLIPESQANSVRGLLKEFRQGRKDVQEEQEAYDQIARVHAAMAANGEIEKDDPAWYRRHIRALEDQLERLEATE